VHEVCRTRLDTNFGKVTVNCKSRDFTNFKETPDLPEQEGLQSLQRLKNLRRLKFFRGSKFRGVWLTCSPDERGVHTVNGAVHWVNRRKGQRIAGFVREKGQSMVGRGQSIAGFLGKMGNGLHPLAVMGAMDCRVLSYYP
jgi:hypothetical protein